MPPSTVEQ
uniref:Uncharacterized protein n=1 Tax=Anguilla anguilla TaxID=7936 RepID=A0A0E9UK87_ANGAN